MNVPDFLPAMQKALFVRLSQKHQDDGEQMSKQCQRSLSREEGIFRLCICQIQYYIVCCFFFRYRNTLLYSTLLCLLYSLYSL